MKTPRRSSNPQSDFTKSSLKSLNVKPVKTRGQNFVVNPEVITAIVDFANPATDEYLVEIGPGLGALTDMVIKTCPNMSVVEIEKKFCDELQQKYPKINVFNEDARKFNFQNVLDHKNEGQKLAVFGNIPYIFSTEIVFHLLANPQTISRFVLLLQKEFAQRMGASPGGKDYGILSIMTQILCNTRLGPIISGNQFFPVTKVQSQVIECTFKPDALVKPEELPFFRRVVKASFHQRRKKIINSLMSGGFAERGLIENALAAAGIDSGRRAETVSILEYLKLVEEIKKL